MKSDEKKLLHEWTLQQSEFSKNDLLVSINTSKTVPFAEYIPLEELNKIIIISQNSIKESGINPLCRTFGKLNWEWKGTEIQTPIWIVPYLFKLDKVRKLVHLDSTEENGFINPFLLKKMAELFDISLPESNFEELVEALIRSGFSDIDPDFSVIGNFHHHRYTLLKELQDLAEKNEFSDSLKQFLSGEKSTVQTINLPVESLLPYDADQEVVFKLLQNENCVVQGPPGTGKSQLLTNIIGKLLLSGQSLVFVSEKRAALEVIKKRLGFSVLEKFCSIVTDGISSHEFIQDLKSTWLFLEEYQSETAAISTRKEQQDNLQFTLDILNQPQLIGGVSFAKFNELQSTHAFQKSDNFRFLSNPPSLIDFEKTLATVRKLYEQSIDKSCAQLPFLAIKEGKISQLISTIEKTVHLAHIFEQIQVDFTPNDFEKLQYLSVVYQLFQNELAKKYVAIIAPDSKEQTKFLKLHAAYFQLQKKLEHSSTNLTDWKIIPSHQELDAFLSEKINFFQKQKLKKRWSILNHLPFQFRHASIEKLKNHQSNASGFHEIEDKLTKIGVSDFSDLSTLKASLHLFSKEKWAVYNALTVEQKHLLNEVDSQINGLKDLLKHHFRLNETQSIVKQLSDLSKQLPFLIQLEQELTSLNQSILDAIKASNSFENYKQNIFQTHQTIFSSHYPTLSNFEPSILKEKIESVLVSEKKEHLSTAAKINARIKDKFDHYQQLINTSSAKLSIEEKKLKKELKKGKLLLVKEFSKSRQHPSLRELMSSEAQHWIRLLKPVWLTNPVQLAKVIPLEKEIIDICIVDEASQIPVQNSVGALYRSKRIIIAGDEQQMNPTSYFQAGGKDVISVLHHARFYFQKLTLTHHYRSKHAPLIAFSNRYFYDNKLVVYPSFPVNNQCVHRYFCSEGRYIDRKNTVEAQQIVQLIKDRLHLNETIGVVAFSQEQVDVIWKTIPLELLQEIENRMESDTFFIKPLENVQGDECEHLIISLGYAPDEAGNFHLRFGPLNTESGRNRLNVLFSRASETIDFVCSIESSVLQWSENESIQLLYKWLRNIEQPSENQTIDFPLGLKPEIIGNKLIFKNSYTSIPNAIELITTYTVLKNRGWNVDFS